MNYYLISPRVDGQTIEGFLERMHSHHIVMMGWGTDNPIGVAFSSIKKGDFILVAQRVNWKFNHYFAGIVDDNVGFEEDGFQCRKLKYFVDLRNSDTDYLEGVSFAEMNPLKAMMAIKPYNNQKVIDRLNTIIIIQKKKEDMETLTRLLQNNHNLILTGAPGTGKTYLAKQIAESMGAKWKLVQFHPSYDYTDFVEGLRPIEKDGTLGFERKDGVFKEFCKNAISTDSKSSDFDSLYQEVVKKIKDGVYTTYEADIAGTRSLSIKEEHGITQIVFRTESDNPKTENVETAKKMFEQLIKDRVLDVKSYKTEDFYELVKRATNNTVKTVDKAEYAWLLQLLLDMYYKNTAPYVFIVDEINRGEISKIFGELFFSIDPGYRGEKGKVSTQYQNLVKEDDLFYNGFYVPENVFIIGTMNDIDRSVESMDFAMRRRFAWKEITVESRQSMLDEEEAWSPNAKPASSIIDEIKNRMNNLNACIIDQYQSDGLSSKDKIGLTKAYQIGASYFLKYGLYNNFEELWVNHLEGLLYEYLRGTTNIETKMERLRAAYNDSEAH